MNIDVTNLDSTKTGKMAGFIEYVKEFLSTFEAKAKLNQREAKKVIEWRNYCAGSCKEIEQEGVNTEEYKEAIVLFSKLFFRFHYVAQLKVNGIPVMPEMQAEFTKYLKLTNRLQYIS